MAFQQRFETNMTQCSLPKSIHIKRETPDQQTMSCFNKGDGFTSNTGNGDWLGNLSANVGEDILYMRPFYCGGLAKIRNESIAQLNVISEPEYVATSDSVLQRIHLNAEAEDVETSYSVLQRLHVKAEPGDGEASDSVLQMSHVKVGPEMYAMKFELNSNVDLHNDLQNDLPDVLNVKAEMFEPDDTRVLLAHYKQERDNGEAEYAHYEQQNEGIQILLHVIDTDLSAVKTESVDLHSVTALSGYVSGSSSSSSTSNCITAVSDSVCDVIESESEIHEWSLGTITLSRGNEVHQQSAALICGMEAAEEHVGGIARRDGCKLEQVVDHEVCVTHLGNSDDGNDNDDEEFGDEVDSDDIVDDKDVTADDNNNKDGIGHVADNNGDTADHNYNLADSNYDIADDSDVCGDDTDDFGDYAGTDDNCDIAINNNGRGHVSDANEGIYDDNDDIADESDISVNGYVDDETDTDEWADGNDVSSDENDFDQNVDNDDIVDDNHCIAEDNDDIAHVDDDNDYITDDNDGLTDHSDGIDDDNSGVADNGLALCDDLEISAQNNRNSKMPEAIKDTTHTELGQARYVNVADDLYQGPEYQPVVRLEKLDVSSSGTVSLQKLGMPLYKGPEYQPVVRLEKLDVPSSGTVSLKRLGMPISKVLTDEQTATPPLRRGIMTLSSSRADNAPEQVENHSSPQQDARTIALIPSTTSKAKEPPVDAPSSSTFSGESQSVLMAPPLVQASVSPPVCSMDSGDNSGLPGRYCPPLSIGCASGSGDNISPEGKAAVAQFHPFESPKAPRRAVSHPGPLSLTRKRRRGARKSPCPVKGCRTKCRYIRHHAERAHLPHLFWVMYSESAVYPLTVRARCEALDWLFLHLSLTPGMALRLARCKGPSLEGGILPRTQVAMASVCKQMGWQRPPAFSLVPPNSPACFLHWRLLLFLVGRLSRQERGEFMRWAEWKWGKLNGAWAPQTSQSPDSPRRLCSQGVGIPRTNPSMAPFSQGPPTTGAPAPLFLLMTGSPQPVTLVGAGWTSARPVPLMSREIVPPRTLGEIGLDFSQAGLSVSSAEQLMAFGEVLSFAHPDQVLLLRFRGSTNDPLAQIPMGLAYVILRRQLVDPGLQRMRLRCFTGGEVEVQEWSEAFPHAYFGFTALVRQFSIAQRRGLRAVPRSRLLLESDSLHLHHGSNELNYFGNLSEVAQTVAAVRDESLQEVTEMNHRNAFRLYF